MRRVTEPRQPQKHKGAVVHTEQTPGYDDSATTRAINDTLMGVNALREEMKAPMPSSVARGTDNGEEPTMPKAKNGKALKLGEQGRTIVDTVNRVCNTGDTFNANDVWEWMGHATREKWVKAYGGRDVAFSKVKTSLSNVEYAGRIGITRINRNEWVYSGTAGKKSKAYQRSIDKTKSKKASKTKVPVDKPASKPATPKSTTVPLMDEYQHIGYDLDMVPIYIRESDGEIGNLVFQPSL